MELFLQQVLAGLANGAIYASLGLAIVMIYQATDHINFAQGEMAMFSTFIAWTLIADYGVPYWLAFFITLVTSFHRGSGYRTPRIRSTGQSLLLEPPDSFFGIVCHLQQFGG